jgi:hypothetical protein
MAKRGPRTEAGKRKAALNALTHGVLARTPIIPGVEAQAEWDRHIQGFHQSLAPADEFEVFFVDTIAQTAWRLKRLALYENEKLALAQLNVEERAAARILYPAGDGAISLHGASAATLIEDRIDRLQRLAGLLLDLQAKTARRTRLTREEVQLLYEGLSLAITPSNLESEALQRQVIRGLSTPTPEEETRAHDIAANVRGLLRELEEAINEDSLEGGTHPAHPEAPEGPFSSPRPSGERVRERGSPEEPDPPNLTISARYPIDLVLIRVWPEIQRLEHEQLDLETTIDRLRRESLLLDADELALITRYEAHLRRQLVQFLHELEARQSQRGGRPAPLARLDIQHMPS